VLGLLCLLGFVGLAARLAYLQLYRHRHYVAEAAALRVRHETLPARRGGLLDRNGIALVQDRAAFEVTMDPNAWYAAADERDTATSPEERKARCLATIRRWMPEVRIDSVLARRPIRWGRSTKKKRRITYDLGKVTPVVAERLKKAKVPGLGLRESTDRSALDGSLAPHVIGFTNSRGVGLEGLERRLEKTLGGQAGIREGEFDNRRGALRYLQPIPGTVRREKPVADGQDVVLTLDARIQRHAQDVLSATCRKTRAESGSVVVLDPNSGEILALASYPTFDVNAFGQASPSARINRATVETYEPGSTLKAVTVAAALETRAVSEERLFFCNGALRVGKNVIHCADHGGHGGGHGSESLTDVIRSSCNVATAQCAFALSKPRLFEYLRRFGLTSSTESGLPGEAGGQLSPPSRWSKIQLANIGFGQGIAVTPLQLASSFSVFSDGVWRQPHIIRGTVDPQSGKILADAPPRSRRVLSPETARTMRRMLAAVVERGTGRNARLVGYTAGGKTGTAQVAEGGRYGGKYVASFVGLAPLAEPQVVVLVAIRDPKGKEHYGGEIAAPAFQKIAEDALLLMRVPRDRQTLAPARDGTPVERASLAEH
jgi:stage V sporulation protein D (sporulation-specific penicillin-binding protein)